MSDTKIQQINTTLKTLHKPRHRLLAKRAKTKIRDYSYFLFMLLSMSLNNLGVNYTALVLVRAIYLCNLRPTGASGGYICGSVLYITTRFDGSLPSGQKFSREVKVGQF